jgi:hypothetical protein
MVTTERGQELQAMPPGLPGGVITFIRLLKNCSGVSGLLFSSEREAPPDKPGVPENLQLLQDQPIIFYRYDLPLWLFC